MCSVIITGMTQEEHNYHFRNQDKDMMRATIDLVYNNQQLRVEVKQPYGTNFVHEEGFEMFIPFNSPLRELKYSALSDKCEEYYRSLVGGSGSMIQIGEGCSNIKMSNNIVQSSWSVEIPLADDNATTW